MSHNFRSRLRSGERLIGTMLTLPTTATAEILADCGFDWLMIDCEHGPLETRDVLGILQAVGHRIPCIVRVPCGDEVSIKKVLDLGADGIIVPQVNTAERAKEAVRFSRYSPEGERGVGLARAQGYGLRFQEYLSSANDDVAVIVQAEHADAVGNISEIAAVGGIDAVFVGPYDLSASLGKMGLIDAPVVVEAIDHVTTACKSAGIPLALFGVSANDVQPSIEKGYTLIALSTDALLLGAAAKQMLDEIQ